MRGSVSLNQQQNVKTKYQSFNLNSTYKQPAGVRTQPTGYGRMVVLGRGRGRGSSGKGTTKVAAPKPINLPSLKSENNLGLDPTVPLVPAGGSGWIISTNNTSNSNNINGNSKVDESQQTAEQLPQQQATTVAVTTAEIEIISHKEKDTLATGPPTSTSLATKKAEPTTSSGSSVWVRPVDSKVEADPFQLAKEEFPSLGEEPLKSPADYNLRPQNVSRLDEREQERYIRRDEDWRREDTLPPYRGQHAWGDSRYDRFERPGPGVNDRPNSMPQYERTGYDRVGTGSYDRAGVYDRMTAVSSYERPGSYERPHPIPYDRSAPYDRPPVPVGPYDRPLGGGSVYDREFARYSEDRFPRGERETERYGFGPPRAQPYPNVPSQPPPYGYRGPPSARPIEYAPTRIYTREEDSALRRIDERNSEKYSRSSSERQESIRSSGGSDWSEEVGQMDYTQPLVFADTAVQTEQKAKFVQEREKEREREREREQEKEREREREKEMEREKERERELEREREQKRKEQEERERQELEKKKKEEEAERLKRDAEEKERREKEVAQKKREEEEKRKAEELEVIRNQKEQVRIRALQRAEQKRLEEERVTAERISNALAKKLAIERRQAQREAEHAAAKQAMTAVEEPKRDIKIMQRPPSAHQTPQPPLQSPSLPVTQTPQPTQPLQFTSQPVLPSPPASSPKIHSPQSAPIKQEGLLPTPDPRRSDLLPPRARSPHQQREIPPRFQNRGGANTDHRRQERNTDYRQDRVDSRQDWHNQNQDFARRDIRTLPPRLQPSRQPDFEFNKPAHNRQDRDKKNTHQTSSVDEIRLKNAARKWSGEDTTPSQQPLRSEKAHFENKDQEGPQEKRQKTFESRQPRFQKERKDPQEQHEKTDIPGEGKQQTDSSTPQPAKKQLRQYETRSPRESVDRWEPHGLGRRRKDFARQQRPATGISQDSASPAPGVSSIETPAASDTSAAHVTTPLEPTQPASPAFSTQERDFAAGRGDFVARGRGQFAARGRGGGEFTARRQGEFVLRGRGEFVSRGRGEFMPRGRGRGRGRGEGRGRGRGDQLAYIPKKSEDDGPSVESVSPDGSLASPVLDPLASVREVSPQEAQDERGGLAEEKHKKDEEQQKIDDQKSGNVEALITTEVVYIAEQSGIEHNNTGEFTMIRSKHQDREEKKKERELLKKRVDNESRAPITSKKGGKENNKEKRESKKHTQSAAPTTTTTVASGSPPATTSPPAESAGSEAPAKLAWTGRSPAPIVSLTQIQMEEQMKAAGDATPPVSEVVPEDVANNKTALQNAAIPRHSKPPRQLPTPSSPPAIITPDKAEQVEDISKSGKSTKHVKPAHPDAPVYRVKRSLSPSKGTNATVETDSKPAPSSIENSRENEEAQRSLGTIVSTSSSKFNQSSALQEVQRLPVPVFHSHLHQQEQPQQQVNWNNRPLESTDPAAIPSPTGIPIAPLPKNQRPGIEPDTKYFIPQPQVIGTPARPVVSHPSQVSAAKMAPKARVPVMPTFPADMLPNGVPRAAMRAWQQPQAPPPLDTYFNPAAYPNIPNIFPSPPMHPSSLLMYPNPFGGIPPHHLGQLGLTFNNPAAFMAHKQPPSPPNQSLPQQPPHPQPPQQASKRIDLRSVSKPLHTQFVDNASQQPPHKHFQPPALGLHPDDSVHTTHWSTSGLNGQPIHASGRAAGAPRGRPISQPIQRPVSMNNNSPPTDDSQQSIQVTTLHQQQQTVQAPGTRTNNSHTPVSTRQQQPFRLKDKEYTNNKVEDRDKLRRLRSDRGRGTIQGSGGRSSTGAGRGSYADTKKVIYVKKAVITSSSSSDQPFAPSFAPSSHPLPPFLAHNTITSPLPSSPSPVLGTQ